MTTNYSYLPKRKFGSGLAIVDDPVVTVDSATVESGGVASPTAWTFINKTS